MKASRYAQAIFNVNGSYDDFVEISKYLNKHIEFFSSPVVHTEDKMKSIEGRLFKVFEILIKNGDLNELDDIANRILANQEEARKLQDQLLSQKLMTFYKEKMTFKTKKVSYEGFIKEVYK